MTDDKAIQEVQAKIGAGLSTAQTERSRNKLEAMALYWRTMAEDPDNQWWDVDKVRNHGKLESIQEDEGEFRLSINYIAQELLNMVASDLLAPFRYRVNFKFFDPTEPLQLEQIGMDPMGDISVIQPDAYQDRVKGVIDAYLAPDKLNLNDARLRSGLIRYTDGTSYLTLDWDADAGKTRTRQQRKNGDKWDVVVGQWSKDGQFFEIPQSGVDETGKPLSPEQVPVDVMNDPEMYREEILAVGEPRLLTHNLTQILWDLEPGEVCVARIRGVYLIDWISKSDAKRDYKVKKLWGQEVEAEDNDFNLPADNQTTGAWTWMKSQLGLGQKSDQLPRIRYRRKPNIKDGETRSQWFTLVGGCLVRAGDCPYGKSFDVSFGIYPYIDRPSTKHLEGNPSIAYMIAPQKVVNAIDSLILEYIEQMPYGAFSQLGTDEVDTNVTGGGGPKIIGSARPLTPIQLTQLGQEVFSQKADMKYLIQYFGRANQLVQGSRSQDADTLGQAAIQQAYGQKMTSFNQFNDSSSWSMLLNDLMTLLGDKNLVQEKRTIKNVMQKPSADGKTMLNFVMEYTFSAALFNYVDGLCVTPEDLQVKTDEEEKRDIVASMQMMNPMDQIEAGLIKDLKKRWFELSNIHDLVYPAAEVMIPGIPGGGEVGEQDGGLASPDAGTDNLPANASAETKETIAGITG